MECPKCQAPMTALSYEGVEVDRCTSCQGIWFDLGEADKLREFKGSEQVDTGDPLVGKKMNEAGTIDCPRCHTRMIRMVDPRQTHIWYEGCSVCNGMFLDAGEFRDLKKETFLDRIRDLLTCERR